MSEPKNILLLINPRARSGEGQYEAIRDACSKEGFKVVDLSEEERKGNFCDLIHRHSSSVDMVVVGGGDGTINHTLPALVKAKLPLVVYPMGTANLLARSLDIQPGIEPLISAIKNGEEKVIDLGMVNGIYFINVCGLGISTEVNQRVSPTLKKLTGPFSFWLTGLKISKTLKPFKMKLTVDDQKPIERKTWQITVCNGKKYAAWMTIEPQASYDDHTLRCLSTEIKEWWQGFRLLPCYIKGRYHDDLDVNFLRGKKITIETKKPLSIDVDGDVQTKTPATFEVKESALRLLVHRSAQKSTP
jgi:diacylglycerol kinase (ATP)